MPSAHFTTAPGARPPRPRRGPRGSVRRRLVVAGFVIVGLLTGAAYVLDLLTRTDSGAQELPEPGGAPSGQRVSPEPAALTRSPTLDRDPPQPRAAEPAPVLSLPGDFPSDGPGTLRYADGPGEVLGEAGQLRQFRVAVEVGIDEQPGEFARFVDTTLAAASGWAAGDDLRFQRVAEGSGHDFTILLATAGTTQRLCASGGLRVVAPALPDGGVSCRLPGQVVINLHRWRSSVPHYIDAGVPLHLYRQMLLNHEIGHELGYGHEGCPGAGEPAPVMQQQTITLDGCRAYPWPHRDGARYTGPPVP